VGFLDDIKDTVGDVAETGWRATTAPYKALENTAKVITGSEKPKAIFKPYKDLGRSAGNAVAGATNLSQTPQKELYKRINKYAAKYGGDVGEFIFDISTFSQKFYNELAVASGHSLANALRGQNPLQVTAAPLAGAIRAAREKHLARAKPIPQDVKQELNGFFSTAILNRAKYTVGKVDITLPNFIGNGAKFMGNDYAVVVDDIIVFNDTPPSFSESPFWWTHEVAHIDQYHRWGVESFAFRYIRDLGSSIEAEADQRAYSKTGNNKLIGAAALSASVGQLGLHTNTTSSRRHVGQQNVQPNSEFFVAQCFFPQDPMPIHYMITNTRKIIAVDAYSGNWLQVGWVTPPLAPNVAWTYQTQRFRYAVFNNGGICTANQFGQYIQIGHVVRW